MNSQGQAIGRGSFYKLWSRDYTNEECDLPQGHKDRIRMVDLLPEATKCLADVGNDSMLATNWLEHTGELYPSLNILFGKGTFPRFAMGDLCLAYGNFYTGVTNYFTQMRSANVIEYHMETAQEIQLLKEMNTKRGIPADTGVEKLQQECKQALQEHINNLMTCFNARSKRWLDCDRPCLHE